MDHTDRYPLVVATDMPPIGSHTGGFPLGQAHAPLMHAVVSRHGTWLAASDSHGSGPSSWLRTVTVEAEVLAAHRDGHCATTVAGAYFGHTMLPEQRPGWLQAHRLVAGHYAGAIARLAAPEAQVWLHDYQLQLVPAMLRRQRPDVRIGITYHCPFPPAESFLALAERDEILAALHAADVIAFQENRSEANFLALAAENRNGDTDTCDNPTRTVVMPMPAETASVAHLASETKVHAAAARIRAAVRPASAVFLSTGGNDPADGSLQRLQEFAHLLATRQLDPRQVAYIHLAPTTGFPGVPSQDLRADLERLVAQINGQFASPGHCPVHYQRRDVTPAEMTALYLAADVMLATPMRDRSTPHAAEYAAAHADGRGHIVLSEFSSTAHQLTGAHLLNPHEPGALARAMVAATRTRQRSLTMTQMHRHVLHHGVAGWADRFLSALAGRPADIKPASRTQGARRLITTRTPTHHSTVEGSTRSAQASDTSSHLTATAPHP